MIYGNILLLFSLTRIILSPRENLDLLLFSSCPRGIIMFFPILDLILCCDWLSGWARWRYLIRSGLHAVSRKKIVLSGTNPGTLFHIL